MNIYLALRSYIYIMDIYIYIYQWFSTIFRVKESVRSQI